jgi:hypothetical protein
MFYFFPHVTALVSVCLRALPKRRHSDSQVQPDKGMKVQDMVMKPVCKSLPSGREGEGSES